MNEKDKEYYLKMFLDNSYYFVLSQLENDRLSKEEIKEILESLKKRFVSNTTNKKNLSTSDTSNVDIPEQLTLGIELEMFVKNQDIKNPKTAIKFENICSNINDDMCEIVNYLGWNFGHDESIRWNVDGREVNDGIEITSPILNSKEYNIREEINNICKLAFLSNCTVNNTCGMHVHVGANYLENAQAYLNLLELWCNNEDLLYLISNPPNDLVRESALRNIDPQADCWSTLIKSGLERGSLIIDKDDTVKEVKNKLIKFQKANPTISSGIDPNTGKSSAKRQRGLNFLSLEKYGTIEFRIHNGSIDSKTLCENINLDSGLIVFSQYLSLIQGKKPSELSEEEIEVLNRFEKITSKKDEITLNERLDTLLNLIIPKNQNKDIYIERYLTNIEMLKNNSELENLFKRKIIKEPIKLQPIFEDKVLNTVEKENEVKKVNINHYEEAYSNVKTMPQTAKSVFREMLQWIHKKMHSYKNVDKIHNSKNEESLDQEI